MSSFGMDPSEMKPIYLLHDELNYELRIRGIVTTKKDAVVKRKMLTRALEIEKHRNLNLVDPDYDFETEVNTINNALDSLRTLITDFEGPETDSGYKRIRTRLIYITNRVKRIDTPEEGEDKESIKGFKDESYATCCELEALLHDKISSNILVPDLNVSSAAVSEIVTTATQNSAKAIPVYKWNLHFSGDDNFSLKSFLVRVEELSAARKVSNEELFSSAIDLFSGSALLWFRSMRNSVHD